MKASRLTYQHTILASYFGYITQAIVNNLAPMLFLIFSHSFDIPMTQFTLLITVNFCVQLTVDFAAARFADKIGYRICIVAAHLFSGAGLIGLAILPSLLPDPFAGLLLSVILYAIGGGLIEVLISPIVEACPTDNKASVMSLLHSFYCWGVVAVVLLSTVFFAVAGKDGWPILCCLWALVPLINAVAFCRVPLAALTEEGEGMSTRQLFSLRLFWLFILLMIASGACELAMSQWASAFAERGLNVSKTVGDLAGPCMFAILMGLSRVFYAKFSEKIDLLSFLIGSGILCALSYLLAALAPNPILSLIGCALCGLSVGIFWPGVFSLASAAFPTGGTAMFAFLALAGDFGCSSGPTLVGAVARIFDENLKPGLLAAVLFPAMMITGGLILKSIRRKAEKSAASRSEG